MEPHSQLQARRKRRRRRRQDRPAISARLLLDERMKGDVGVLSEDLFADLFPANSQIAGRSTETHNGIVLTPSPEVADQDHQTHNPIRHVAIAPWMPASVISAQSAPWSILPVRVAAKTDTSRPHSSLQFSAVSPALQTFLHALQVASPGKPLPRKETPIEIRILDVIPIGLETVFVSLDTEDLKKLDEVHQKFGGGFPGSPGKQIIPKRHGLLTPKHAAKKPPDTSALEASWRKAVREALKAPKLVHAGDLLQLPLPAHPITHVPPKPAKITACEPVSQGLLLPSTRIVIVHSHRLGQGKAPTALPVAPQIANGIAEDDEDTSNEQFYSAAEERSMSQNSTPPNEDSSTDNLDSEVSGTDHDDLSDDSEDGFSLSTAMLPQQTTGVLSTFTSATPRPGAYLHTNGIATPGSTYSSFTATTVRGGSGQGRLFKAQGLLQRLPEELLHPKPGAEEDEEARVYVETSTLVKIGCFSGDWVKIEVAAEQSSHTLAPWMLASFGEHEEETSQWRAVKVYGLPDPVTRKASRLPTHKAVMRKSSFLDFMRSGSTSAAFASPVLLANLGEPTHLRISPISSPQPSVLSPSSTNRGKITSACLPPFAKEVTLLKISTPLSTDRSLQPSMFSSLKEYFEQKRRIVKEGDLIGIAVDETLGRSMFQGTAGDDAADDNLLSKRQPETESGSRDKRSTSVTWFKIGHVTTSRSEDDENDVWGGVACADAANMKMVQAGSEQAKVPPTINNPWQYYLGAKALPAGIGAGSGKVTGTSDPPEPHISPLRRRLRELISASMSPQAIHLGLPPLAILLTSTQRQIGKSFVTQRACEDLGLHTFPIDGFDILTEGGSGGGDVKTEGFLKARAERALTCGAQYTALLIKHIDALNADRMLSAFKEILADSRVLIATTTDVDKLPDGIRGLFTHEMEMNAPDEKEREGILHSIVEDAGIRLAPDVELSSVALKTAALVAGDLVDVIDRALVAKQNRLKELVETSSKLTPAGVDITVRDVEVSGGSAALSLTKADFESAVDHARKNFADAIGAPKIPNVTWDDVGGLTHIKDAVMETIQLPLQRPELFAKGMKKRSGILFYGPPGTGKTLLAKAIATEFSLNFFSVKGPELLNMYIGESEANVRRVFQRARDARPCVVFFDELDSVAPKRGNQGDSGGVMDRIVSQLLAELDGMSDGEEGSGGVFVIGATNRPDLLDQALLRPGRFDKMLYLGISDTHDKQLTILEALSRK
jgi:peroxin-6